MSDHIPFAIQEEIMKRLPTKSLMQFRSVSKPWKSLIDSPKFITDYSFNHTHQHHLLVSNIVIKNHEQKYVSFVADDTFPLEKIYLPNPIPGPVTPLIVGSCQGLFCLYTVCCTENRLKTVHLWNPSIRKLVPIDVSHETGPGSRAVIGFGVCPHTSDHKLVKINFARRLLDKGYTGWPVEVYTLSSRAWRSIPAINQPRKLTALSPNQVVVNEFIYWVALDVDEDNVILSFDLTSEGFMQVSLPDILARANNYNLGIAKLKESLVVVEGVIEAQKRVYNVWMLERGVLNSFAKLFTINSPDASILGPIGFWKNNEPIFAMRADNDVDDILVHELHLEHKSFFGIFGNGFSFRVSSYMETLLLLDH